MVTLATEPAHGAAVVNADSTITYTPARDYFGADYFTYEVADREGQLATATVSITVTPVDDGEPIAVADAATTAEGAAVTVPVLVNDTVTDGVQAVTILTPPAHGSAAVNADRTVTYSPTAGFNGEDAFAYQVTDTDGQSASAPVGITVTPVDSGAPVPAPDAFTTPEDTPYTVAVLANDTVLDPPAVVTLEAPPAHGRASVNADGTIAYTPAPDFNGADAFTYRVADRDGQSATATVSITVTAVNDGPVAAADAVNASAGWPVVIPVLANDTDPDGDPLSVLSATQGTHGTVTVLADGTVKYEADPTFTGIDTFTYVVSDGAASATGIVTVTVGPPADSDGDGIPDHVEDPDHDGTVGPGETDPGNPDTDGDGLPDGVEDANHDGTVDQGETDPRNPDTNGDGILDGIGVRGGGCASGPGGAASLLLVGMALALRRRGRRAARS